MLSATPCRRLSRGWRGRNQGLDTYLKVPQQRRNPRLLFSTLCFSGQLKPPFLFALRHLVTLAKSPSRLSPLPLPLSEAD